MASFFYRYRILEIIQVFGISVSLFFFTLNIPEMSEAVVWSAAMLSSIASAFWLNDYCDFTDDLHNPRKIRYYSRKRLLIFMVLAMVLSFTCSLFISMGLFYIVTVTALVSALYSLPRVRLKSRLYLPFLVHFFMGIIFFLSASQIVEVYFGRELLLMTFFWGLILASGSLGNELVDLEVDRRNQIATIANTFPARARLLMLFVLSLAFFILIINMILLELRYSLTCSVLVAVAFSFFKGPSQEALRFRKLYRYFFVTIILIFHLELLLRG